MTTKRTMVLGMLVGGAIGALVTGARVGRAAPDDPAAVIAALTAKVNQLEKRLDRLESPTPRLVLAPTSVPTAAPGRDWACRDFNGVSHCLGPAGAQPGKTPPRATPR